MINDLNHQLPLVTYAQASSVAGSWMELVDRHLPNPLSPYGGRFDPPQSGHNIPPFNDPDDTWALPDFLQDPDIDLYSDQISNLKGHWEDDCDCGGAPPPIFNIPPPPPPPMLEEEHDGNIEGYFPPEGDAEEPFYERGKTFPKGNGKFTFPTKATLSKRESDCEHSFALPQDACPAFLIAGDAHIRPPRLQPPIAALLVGATTFALVIGIAAAVCWRLRRHRTRVNSSKTSADLSNGGVIYEDLPSGPTPRMLPTGGQDTRTLAPMELLDLKRASKLHNSSYGGLGDNVPRNIIHQFPPDVGDGGGGGTLVPPPSNLYPQFTYQYSQKTEPKNKAKEFCYDSQRTIFSDFTFKPSSQENILSSYPYSPSSQENTNNSHETSPRCLDSITFNRNHNSPYQNNLEDILKADYSEPGIRNAMYKNSQELYNPTYEEIGSTGSYSTSVTSGSSDDDGTLPPSPQTTTLISPSECFSAPDNSWSSASHFPRNSAKKPSPKRYSASTKRKERHQDTPLSSATSITEISDYHDGMLVNPHNAPPSVLYRGNAPPIPPPALYTIPGTSDGRTSTSSSSDLPDRCPNREPHYYVVPQSRSPSTPSVERQSYANAYSSSQLHQKEGLPPLPSRSDRYRIYFTTERRRGLGSSRQCDSKTLDISSRKRNKEKDVRTQVENEPLYHEL